MRAETDIRHRTPSSGDKVCQEVNGVVAYLLLAWYAARCVRILPTMKRSSRDWWTPVMNTKQMFVTDLTANGPFSHRCVLQIRRLESSLNELRRTQRDPLSMFGGEAIRRLLAAIQGMKVHTLPT